MMPKYNIVPNEWNYNMMIMKNIKFLRIDKAKQLYDQMKKDIIPYNTSTFNAFIEINARFK